MELIDRYIYAVGRRLPKKMRADIEKELKSLIMDELEERTEGREPDDEDILAVLKKLGSPQAVAAQYTGWPQYLIGPELFPIYKIVAAIVFAAMSMGLVVAFVVNLMSNGGNLLIQFLELLGQIITGAASAFGFLTLGFAIVEHLMARGHMEKFWKEVNDDADIQKAKEWFSQMEWDPEKLKPVPAKEDTTKPLDHILGIALTLIVLVLFNCFHDKLVLSIGGSACTPILSAEALRTLLPLWNTAWVLSIGKDSLLLARGRWELMTHIYDIALSLLDIVILYILLTGPFLINEALFALFAEHVPFIGGYIKIFVMIAFGIALAATAIKTVVKTSRLIRERA